jgi:hypothetical protein
MIGTGGRRSRLGLDDCKSIKADLPSSWGPGTKVRVDCESRIAREQQRGTSIGGGQRRLQLGNVVCAKDLLHKRPS